MPTSAPGELARALTTAIAAIHERGWCDGTGGNFSCVRSRNPLELLMAPSGVDKGLVQPDDLIVVDAGGQVVEGNGAASAETLLHLEIVQRTGAGAVLHTHSQAGTLLSRRSLEESPRRGAAAVRVEGLEMLKGLEGIRTHECAVAIPVLANDQDLHRLSLAAAPHLNEAPHGLLIAGHGLYAWGRDLFSARRHLEILEFLLEQRWRELLLPPPVSGLQQSFTGARDSLIPAAAGISHVLLDIEGTTCPVSFVADTLFPYARARLGPYLQEHSQDLELRDLFRDLNKAWQEADDIPQGLNPAEEPSLQQLREFLESLIDRDRKLTALKELQGLIWREGYASGTLRAPLFEDVPAALKGWKNAGLQLSVYSSGSVAAQQLLYAHSDAGDLRHLFTAWFDTRVGSKQDPASYQRIAGALGTPPDTILFVSDSLAELDAADQSGLAVRFSSRPGNPERDPGSHAVITTLEQIRVPC